VVRTTEWASPVISDPMTANISAATVVNNDTDVP
jgi:hypothetical protein